MPTTTNLFARGDTFFGVCAGIGEDFGFHPNFLRAAFGVLLLVKLPLAAGLYALLGLAVLAARLLFPVASRASKATASRIVISTGSSDASNDTGVDLPLAA